MLTTEKQETKCEYNSFRQLRYFPGLLLDDRDFVDQQTYHIQKRRLLNRTLYGWGVVCGLDLKREKDPHFFTVTSGLALDCCGREIWVDRNLTIDVRALEQPRTNKNGKAGETKDCPEPPEQGKPRTVYVGIAYKEDRSDPKPVYVTRNGCEDLACEPTRIKEGYCVTLLPNCPKDDFEAGLIKELCTCQKELTPTSEDPQNVNQNEDTECEEKALKTFCVPMPCPECAEADTRERYVIVGSIQLECDTILEVNPLDCRTYVLSPYFCRYLGNQLLSGLKGEWEKTGENGKAKKIEFDLTRLVKNPIQGLCWVFDRLIHRRPLLPDDLVKCCTGLFERMKPNSRTPKPKGKKELEGESWEENPPAKEGKKRTQAK